MTQILVAPRPVADLMRVLELEVRASDGRTLGVQVPWDLTAYDLEPVLVAGRELGDDRMVRAFPSGEDHLDLLEVPLRQALRTPASPAGTDALVIRVETATGHLAFTVRCAGVAEPQAHQAYPRGSDPVAETLVDAFLADQDAHWFCDGASTLSCCEAARSAPDKQDWVEF